MNFSYYLCDGRRINVGSNSVETAWVHWWSRRFHFWVEKQTVITRCGDRHFIHKRWIFAEWCTSRTVAKSSLHHQKICNHFLSFVTMGYMAEKSLFFAVVDSDHQVRISLEDVVNDSLVSHIKKATPKSTVDCNVVALIRCTLPMNWSLTGLAKTVDHPLWGGGNCKILQTSHNFHCLTFPNKV